jgi:hypothetical protein
MVVAFALIVGDEADVGAGAPDEGAIGGLGLVLDDLDVDVSEVGNGPEFLVGERGRDLEGTGHDRVHGHGRTPNRGSSGRRRCGRE